MNNKVYIGIDPGKTGFITIYYSENNTFSHLPVPLVGDNVDIYELNRIFSAVVEMVRENGYSVHAVIEDVHAIFGSSAKATFSFGHVLGLLEMAIVANNIPYTKVQPKVWQKEMWQGVPLQQKLSSSGRTMVNNTKLMSQLAAKRLFPGKDFRKTTRCKKDDENLIDSLLICEYCRRKF